MKLSHKEVNTYYDEGIFRKEGYFIRRFMSKSEQLPVYSSVIITKLNVLHLKYLRKIRSFFLPDKIESITALSNNFFFKIQNQT